MYKLKQVPEDFIVEERMDLKVIPEGPYLIYQLIKKDENTDHAAELIANALKIKRKDIGYAGLKDKAAITTQYISIKYANKHRINQLSFHQCHLSFMGYSKEPISLGDHKGNQFVVVVRNLDKNAKIKRLKKYINFFGEQRFSIMNAKIGKSIIKKNFKEAIEAIMSTNPRYSDSINESLGESPSGYVNALRRIPFKILRLYVSSYQSLLWNKTAEQLTTSSKNLEIPLPGFSTEWKDKKIEKIQKDLLGEEQLKLRDFVCREIPELSIEGQTRALLTNVNSLKIGKKELDELNEGKWKIKISFTLNKGCYATVFIEQLLGERERDIF